MFAEFDDGTDTLPPGSLVVLTGDKPTTAIIRRDQDYPHNTANQVDDWMRRRGALANMDRYYTRTRKGEPVIKISTRSSSHKQTSKSI